MRFKLTSSGGSPPVHGWLGLILSLGLALTYTTKLRLSNVPIGLGEFLLSIWLIAVVCRSTVSTKLVRSRVSIYILVFWMLTFLLLGLGWLVANRLGVVSTHSIHNILAYLFVSAICCVLVFNITDGQELDSVFIHTTCIIGCLYLILYFSSLLFSTTFDDYFYYYMEISNAYEFRFHGLSKNPNQLAGVLAILPFLCITMARASATPIRAIAFLLLFLFLALGFHTRTEALLLAWIVGLVVLLLPKSIHKLIRLCGANRNLVVVVFSLFTVISAFLFVGYDVKDKIINTINTIYLSDGNQGAIRANLITNGLKSLSESPVVGLGPGSFSGDFGPFENREVHVTPLDWATQTGSIGLVLLIFLIGLSLYKAWISNRIELLAGMASLIVFAQFHYILRQPIVWVFVVYLITLTPNPHTKHSKQQI